MVVSQASDVVVAHKTYFAPYSKQAALNETASPPPQFGTPMVFAKLTCYLAPSQPPIFTSLASIPGGAFPGVKSAALAHHAKVSEEVAPCMACGRERRSGDKGHGQRWKR